MSLNPLKIAPGSVVPKWRAGQLMSAQLTRAAGARTSVDIELVAFRVLHPDRVVVEPFFCQRASDGGA
jgi:hypothetical protein